MIHTPAVLQARIPHFAKGKSIGNRRLIHQSIRFQRFVFCILMIEFICQVDFPFQKVENSTEVRIAPSTQNLGEYMDYPLPIIRWSTRGFAKFATSHLLRLRQALWMPAEKGLALEERPSPAVLRGKKIL